jgi:ribosome maturation factor RimP
LQQEENKAGKTSESKDDSRIGRLKRLASEACEQAGCYLYDLEILGAGAARILRVTIDRDDRTINVDDCASVSRVLSEKIDDPATGEEWLEGGAYQLEVSSPGLERSLKEARHFLKVIGKTVSVKTFAPFGEFLQNRPDLAKLKIITAELTGFDHAGLEKEEIVLLDAVGELRIPMSKVAKAQTVFVMKETEKPGKKPGKKKH